MEKLIVFVFGSIVGSFLNVCIYRLPKNESVVIPASHCPNCKRPIPWHDNIPILSYIILRAKCRFCGSKIRFRYFIVEVLTAILLTVLFAAFRGTPEKFFAYSVLTCGLIVATFVDFEVQEIPDQITLGGILIGLVLSFIFPSIFGREAARWHGLIYSAIGAVVGGLSIYIIGFFGELAFKREAMGGGDVKLMAAIGAFLGWKLVIMTFFIAPVFGSMVGLFLKMKEGREIIPYGPYLSLGALISIFWGEKILQVLFNGIF
ncbi:MAG: hypothetical protein A2987_07025 [Omnitrophica bacterium RIFCSPLOWO2_01_FULL_45_10]|nr:MAG: hypothetical protein A2987_07025 [Omnitrophica bacterium RIFCSPLOWO2_01_FULL_45_10]